MTTAIKDVYAREILDSRGNPTVEVEVELEGGAVGTAAVPSGASTGAHEAHEQRDGDAKRYLGKGVEGAVRNVIDVIGPRLVGFDALEQAEIDREMIRLDESDNKSRLGANAILGVSMATARAAANQVGLPLWRYLGGAQARMLPTPLMNVLNGGAHADNGLEVQEFMIVPLGQTTFREALRAGVETFHALKSILKSRGLATSVGDEGGFAPRIDTNEKAIEVVVEAIRKAGYEPGKDVALALDVASTELYDSAKKTYTFDKKPIETGALVELYAQWCSKYPIVSIEDGCSEDDWDGTIYSSRTRGACSAASKKRWRTRSW
jgi:enolase